MPVKRDPLPEPAGAPVQQKVLVTVVTGEHNDRILGNADFIQHVEHFAKVAVELEKAVGPIAVFTAALIILAWHHGQVHQCVIEIEKKWCLGAGVFP